ncbi:hypothetical protein ACIA8B_17050 [Micromonospora chalcea]
MTRFRFIRENAPARWKRLFVVASAAMALVLSVGQPAIASPYWQTYTFNSTWHCAQVSTNTSIVAISSCVIVSGNYTQAAVVVTNNTSGFIEIQTEVPPTANQTEMLVVYKNGAAAKRDYCLQSALGPGLSRACMGGTISASCSDYAKTLAGVDVDVNDTRYTYRGFSPTWKMCS